MFTHSALLATAQYGGGPGTGWNNMMNWGGGWFHPFGGLGFLLAIVVVIALIFVLLRRDHRDPAPRTGNAEEILKERYAKGEISLEEYQTMRKNIR